MELKPTYIVCPACHGKTVANSLYCASCGKPMTQQPVCSVCQRPFMENEKFCPNCGQPHVENNA
ncbi:MAG TPA: zinc ribbon domain-containing protein [Bacillota bacterium]|nr:zinc ribbon domain-containing protein [Bacillota bacterium]